MLTKKVENALNKQIELEANDYKNRLREQQDRLSQKAMLDLNAISQQATNIYI